jgi:CubicO group peptidase (beta-lactamase class C family)
MEGCMRFSLVFIIILAAIAQNCRSTVDEQIRSVETHLMPPVVLKGLPVPQYTIEERMSALHVHGVSIVVIRNYEINWAKGYGFADIELKQKVTANTLFQAGSISKPVAAVGAMTLVEQGKLKLDDDVNSYLKEWKVPENEFTKQQKVTLRRLLSHTAGLTVHGFPGYEVSAPVPTVLEVLDGKKPANTAAIRVDILPGTQYRYSGGGYTVAQLMMTEVVGKPFAEFMHQAVLEKAGMGHSTYKQPLPARLTSVAASGYRSNGNAVPGKYHTYPEMAAAGLWTTPSDLARFAIEIQKSREGRSNIILKQATVEEILHEEKQGYGLGFSLPVNNGTKEFGHGGANDGFQALMSATFDGQGFVVMTNSGNGSQLAGEIALSMAATYGWPYEPREREAISLSAEDLAKFAGEYDAVQIGRVKVMLIENHLELSFPVRGNIELYPESADVFFSLISDMPDLRFSKDESGSVTSFTLGSITAKRVK